VATSGRKILPEALLGGLPGDLQLRPDGLPGVLLDAGPLDGCGELGVGLAQLLVGRGDPAQYVERRLGRQPVGSDASAHGGAARIAVGAQRDRAVADGRGELAVRSAGGCAGVAAADRWGVGA
jgi:hypothetical protein